MCGIAGIAGPGDNSNALKRMTTMLAHRGPDNIGYYDDFGLSMGQTRLSIIDLVTGNQPIKNEDGSIWATLNGEIYNFHELRKDLEKKGHVFSTCSDTEVIVHGYEEHGVDFFEKMDGIFAIAIWNALKNELVLVRDYFGVKPLHYYYNGKNLWFASEIKAILTDHRVPKQIDYQALHYFMNLRYIPGRRTLLKDIIRLEPANFLILKNGKIKTTRYCQLTPEKHSITDESYFEEGISHLLEKAVKKQMVSDVELGVYLSGGMDSSSIAAFMQKHSSSPIKTFSLGFNEPTDELDDARIVSDRFGTKHYETSLDPNPLKHFPEVIWHVEEPKENIIQGFLLAKFAKKHVKVVQGGLGGDEIFAGYAINQFMRPVNRIHPLVPDFLSKGLLNPLSKFAFTAQQKFGGLQTDEYRRGLQLLLSVGDPLKYYLILRNVWDSDGGALKTFYGKELISKSIEPVRNAFSSFFNNQSKYPLEKMLWTEFHTKMVDDFLLNEDRTSMAHGLEVRVPFLDKDLVRFSMGIPAALHMKGGQTKYLFRNSMRSVLPEHTINKKKWGFTFNPYYQFQKDLKTAASRILTRKRVEDRGWFNYEYLQNILNHKPHPRLRWHYFFLWLAMGLEIWCEMFLEGNGDTPDFNIESYY